MDAHATARTPPFPRSPTPPIIIWLTALTSTVIPRSLNEPVWLTPHCLTHRSSIPSDFASRGEGISGVKPSPRVTMFSARS